MDQNTSVFKPQKDESRRVKEIMEQVVLALKDKGYEPVSQIIGYILSSTLFTIATGYKFGYLIFLLVFWLAEKCCDKVKEKAKYNMTEEEIKAEEEKSDLGVLIFGVITSIAIIVFLGIFSHF